MIKVLIVEDDPMVTKINEDYIENVEGFKVVGTAPTGEKALKFIKSKDVDLIILDIFMPKMDGLEFLQKARNSNSGVDVIFVTAAKGKNIINRGLHLGAVDYLIKPFTYERMKIALEKYLKRYSILCDDSDASQEELDKMLHIHSGGELPKGIHPITLQSVLEWVERCDDIIDLFAMSKELKISSVTGRHYLDYLVKIKTVFKDIKYGSVGRPTYVYSKIKNKQNNN